MLIRSLTLPEWIASLGSVAGFGFWGEPFPEVRLCGRASFQRANGCSFQLAGVGRNRAPGSEPFIFITSKANRLIEGIQDRMPTILDDRTAEDWMNPGERNLLRLKSLLVAAPDDNLVLSLASSTVNRVNNAGLELLVPVRTISVRRS